MASVDPFNPIVAEPLIPDTVMTNNWIADYNCLLSQLRQLGREIKAIEETDVYEDVLIVLRNTATNAKRIAANFAINWGLATRKDSQVNNFPSCYDMAKGLLSKSLEYNATRALLLYHAMRRVPQQHRMECNTLLSGTILYHKKPEDKQPRSSPTLAESSKMQSLKPDMQQQQSKMQSLESNMQQQQQLKMQSSQPYIVCRPRQSRKIRQNPTTVSRNKSNPQKMEPQEKSQTPQQKGKFSKKQQKAAEQRHIVAPKPFSPKEHTEFRRQKGGPEKSSSDTWDLPVNKRSVGKRPRDRCHLHPEAIHTNEICKVQFRKKSQLDRNSKRK